MRRAHRVNRHYVSVPVSRWGRLIIIRVRSEQEEKSGKIVLLLDLWLSAQDLLTYRVRYKYGVIVDKYRR